MAVSQHTGYKFEYRMGGGSPTYQTIVVADTAFREGDMVNLESGEVDLAVAGDTALLGIAAQTKSGMTASTSTIEVIVDADAVYSVYDNNARTMGDALEVSGATGAMGVTASTNDQFVVVETCTANERTLIRFNVGKHWSNVAQT